MQLQPRNRTSFKNRQLTARQTISGRNEPLISPTRRRLPWNTNRKAIRGRNEVSGGGGGGAQVV